VDAAGHGQGPKVKPAQFEYHRPSTVAEALGLLHEHGDEAKPLAGGQSLVPMLALRLTRFEHLVDLNRVPELEGVRASDGTVIVAGMTRQASVGRDAQIATAVPLLSRATPLIGHFQIRNRGTLGGSLSHADPASEYPAVAVALRAQFEVASVAGRRTLPADEFFVSTWTTALEDDELLVAVHFPVWSGRSGFAIDEAVRRHGDFAVVGAACAIELDGSDRVARAGLALFGVGSTPVGATRAERALAGRPAAELQGAGLAEIGELALADCEPPEDIHASSRYRKQVGARLAARVIARALEEAARRG
jgi:carbon-monoxide dehydrogenase medium subunit